MANEQRAFITMQGNLNSRKLHDPSGFVVMAPHGTRTFRNTAPGRHDGLKAAVLWCTKKGYQVNLVKPATNARTAGSNALLNERFRDAQETALLTLALAKTTEEN